MLFLTRLCKVFIIIAITCPLSALQAQEEDKPTGLLEQAADAMRFRRFHEAEEIYRVLIQQNKDDLTLHHLLGHALINQMKFTECDSMLRRVLERDTNLAGTYWYMGLSAERQRKDTLAAHWFKYYIRKTPNPAGRNLKAWLHVGSAYRRLMHDSGITLDQCLDMIYHYGKYLELNPADPYAGEIRIFLDEVDIRKPRRGDLLIWDEGS